MYLMDTDGKVYVDEPEVSQSVVDSLRKAGYGRLAKLVDGEALYRYNDDGSLDLYFVDDKPFLRMQIPAFGLHIYKEKREYVCEEARIIRMEGDRAKVYIGGRTVDIPEEVLLRW